jgi:hypothetical protein
MEELVEDLGFEPSSVGFWRSHFATIIIPVPGI